MHVFYRLSPLAILALSVACSQTSTQQTARAPEPAPAMASVKRAVLGPNEMQAKLTCDVAYVGPGKQSTPVQRIAMVELTVDSGNKPLIGVSIDNPFAISDYLGPQSASDIFKIDNSGWNITETFNQKLDLRFQLNRETGEVTYRSTNNFMNPAEVKSFTGICRKATSDELRAVDDQKEALVRKQESNPLNIHKKIAFNTPFKRDIGCQYFQGKLMEVAQEPLISEQTWQNAYDQILNMASSHRCLEGQ